MDHEPRRIELRVEAEDVLGQELWRRRALVVILGWRLERVTDNKPLAILQTTGHQCGRAAVIAANLEQIPTQSVGGLQREDQKEMRTVVQVEPPRYVLDWLEETGCQRAWLPDMSERSRRA